MRNDRTCTFLNIIFIRAPATYCTFGRDIVPIWRIEISGKKISVGGSWRGHERCCSITIIISCRRVSRLGRPIAVNECDALRDAARSARAPCRFHSTIHVLLLQTLFPSLFETDEHSSAIVQVSLHCGCHDTICTRRRMPEDSPLCSREAS